jgi:Tfp pilus assembly protein PilF
LALNKRKVLDAARKHAQKGAKAKALKEYNKLLHDDPRDAKLLLEVGDAYRRWGQPEEAIAQYSKVASQYRQDGFDARAVAVFKQILTLDPKHYSAYVSLGELYQRMGLDSEAVGSLQIAADGFHKEGRKAEALDLLRQMAALDPSNTTSRLKVAELLRQEGMEEDAVAEYQAVAAELRNQQDRDQLIVVHDRILEIRPNDLETLANQVRCLMATGALDRAEPLAVRALNTGNETTQYELLIDLYAQMGHDAKLADATRGLAKLYRDRGDEDKARELMQRLPAEAIAATDAKLAVDLSEAEEPMFNDEELLDEPFLTTDDDFEMMSTNAPSSSLSSSAADDSSASSAFGESLADLSLDEVALEVSEAADADATDAETNPTESLPLPEGDPDQLLAEASVYLRYGKHEQAIASLRAVIAQKANHRAALEKLGEAYCANGQDSDAAQAWLKAAEQVRLEGDAPALEVLRDRIAALDPGLAEQVGTIEIDRATSEEAFADPSSDTGIDDTEADGLGVELELDVEVDLNLDDAIEEVAASETDPGFEFESPDEHSSGEFEIDLDEESMSFESLEDPETEESSAEAASSVSVDDDFDFTEDVSFDSDEFVEVADSDSIEIDIEADEFSAEESEGSSQLDATGTASTASASEDSSSTGDSSLLGANLDEEIEEADFYIAQDMFDEAEAIVRRVLEAAPSHARALVLSGEIAAARAGDALAPDEIEVEVDLSGDSPVDDDGSLGQMNLEGAEEAVDDDDAEVSFEVDLDIDFDVDSEDSALEAEEVPEEAAVHAESDADALLSAAEDTKELDDSIDADLEDEPEPEPEIAAESEIHVAPESESTSAGESIEAKDDDPTEVDEPTIDAAETFDLREALADVIADEGADSSEVGSGTLSTVEDGFESIFSDFKKGVSATLGEGDYDTRYDLGIAYREMGLFEDAISEFRVCLDSPTRRFDSLYLMGLCARDLGRWTDAVNHFEQALALPEIPEERLAGVYFDLSICHEGAGDTERARASAQRVIDLEPGFPGAADRLAMLESGESGLPDLGEPGGNYESFDDLFEADEDDEDGDVGIVEAAPAEAFESFDDVVSEAEAALGEANAEFVQVDEADGDPPAPEEAKVAPDPETTNPGDSKKGSRKKISFV